MTEALAAPKDEAFGSTPDGAPVRRVTLSGGGLTAKILTWGAAIQDLRLDGHAPPLVLGFEQFEDYPKHSPYLGAIVGRHANRIRNGRFVLDGQSCAIDAQHPEKHGLHGGSNGFDRRNWRVEHIGDDWIELSLTDPVGEMGFPGTLTASCIYRLESRGILSVELTATTDQPTLCNLAHHSYFNLDDGGASPVLDHQMMIEAGAYLPVDDDLIPTGEVRPVAGTAHDFRKARSIRGAGGPIAYDENFCLAATRRNLTRAAWVRGGRSDVEMEVWTTEPGLQFYSGQYLDLPAIGLEGRAYAAFSGFCLEPQTWPDSPNVPWFPQALLAPGQTYRQKTEYRFGKAQ